MNGFVKIHRQIVKWGWYKDPNTFRVFFHILINANHEDREWRGQIIKRGQWVTTRKKMAEELGISERAVRTAINHLKSTNEVTTKTTNKYTVITVENYSKYQDRTSASDQQNDQQSDQQVTNKRPTSDQQNKKEKNDKNDKKREREEYIYNIKHIARAREDSSHSLFGKLSNVSLSDAEYKDIQDTYQDHSKLINSVSYYLANAQRSYSNHYALILRIAEQDGWPKKRKTAQPEQKHELSEAEQRRQEVERAKFDEYIRNLKIAKGGE